MIRYTQVVNELTHYMWILNRSCPYKEYLLEEFHTKSIVQNIFFYQEAVRIVFIKDEIDFTVRK